MNSTNLNSNHRAFWLIIVVLMIAFSPLSLAGEKPGKKVVSAEGPHETIETITTKMMAVIKNGNKTLKENPEEYYSQIQTTLEYCISFKFIAKKVMGKYAKVATPEQRKLFQETFTRSLVETFGKGMANYQDLKVTTIPFDHSKGDLAVLPKVQVIQEVVAPDGTTRVSYTMAKTSSGQWKMINVILNGINLGMSFRDQFKQAMKQNENNIDKVIQNWAKPV